MKKKIFLILTIFIVFLSVAGCGTKIEATINDNEGKTYQITSSEIIQTYKDNTANYNQKYHYANIEVTSVVEKISGPTQYWDDDEYYYAYNIELDGKWIARVDTDNELLKTLKVGDKVKVSNVIICNTSSSGISLVGVEETKVREDGYTLIKKLELPSSTKIEKVS